MAPRVTPRDNWDKSAASQLQPKSFDQLPLLSFVLWPLFPGVSVEEVTSPLVTTGLGGKSRTFLITAMRHALSERSCFHGIATKLCSSPTCPEAHEVRVNHCNAWFILERQFCGFLCVLVLFFMNIPCFNHCILKHVYQSHCLHVRCWLYLLSFLNTCEIFFNDHKDQILPWHKERSVAEHRWLMGCDSSQMDSKFYNKNLSAVENVSGHRPIARS